MRDYWSSRCQQIGVEMMDTRERAQCGCGGRKGDNGQDKMVCLALYVRERPQLVRYKLGCGKAMIADTRSFLFQPNKASVVIDCCWKHDFAVATADILFTRRFRYIKQMSHRCMKSRKEIQSQRSEIFRVSFEQLRMVIFVEAEIHAKYGLV
jgi:hypothetical protein